MKKFLIGLLVGIFLCVSAFEFIHREIETTVTGAGMCTIIYDALNQRWNPEFTYQAKIVYKFFAWPVKTIYVAISDSVVSVIEEGQRAWYFGDMR